jgi:two-component system, cell cycle response regulator
MMVSRTQGAALRFCGWLAAALMGLYALQVGTDLAGTAVTDAFQDYLYNVLLFAGAAFCLWRAVAVREERLPWAIMGVAIVSWTSADVIWTVLYASDPNAPYPSIADALWLAWYPASYVVLIMLVRSRIASIRASLWLDGVIGALCVIAFAFAFAYEPIVNATSGTTAAVATNLAYPLGDSILLGVIVAVLGLSGWRPGRAWIILGAGLALNALGDVIYLVQTAQGTYVEGSLLDASWPASSLLVGLAAWQPAKLGVAQRVEGLRVVLMPFVCGVVAVALLTLDHFNRLPTAAVGLITATVLLVLIRTALVFRDNQRMIVDSREEAHTDPLTGLRNRRSLMADLNEELPLATEANRRALILFDLDGFKEYNDAFGHPAGDGLLVRLGLRLADAVRGHGGAYRLGGDEFCVLLRPGPAGVDPLVKACVSALSESGEGFDVTTSHGSVLAPEEVDGATAALQLADRRMYARKGGRRMSAGRQSRDVLLRMLSERQPELRAHLRGTAELALDVGRELDMGPEELDEVARAGELHDLGKVAIPDAILHKPGPLDETEWSFVRRHTIIGERVLLAAPALRPVARLVRASHERFDGSGYPDGLAGSNIPLGSRVVAVCDAFDAMISERPYRATRSAPDALAELQSCAGTQFDPVVVAAFARVVTRQTADAVSGRDHAV